jgi:hypothetical protein
MNISFSNTVSPENANKVVGMIDDLENLGNVRELVDLLIA